MTDTLNAIAQQMVAPGKGILAADESSPTIKKRFDTIGVESTEENRQAYRELLFTTKGMSEYISGVILFDETIRQSTKEGVPFPKALADAGILPGIKVDTGAKPLAGADGEKITEGLDGLRERFAEYGTLGAKFAKWRAVIEIGKNIPSEYCIHVNAHALARYAALAQETGIVPIVEPEVLMDGDHDIDRCADVTAQILTTVFAELEKQRVSIPGMILKPNMVVPGKDKRTAPPEEVAEATVGCFRSVLPDDLPGVVFLSGGQSDGEATANLNAMNRDFPDLPWELSFSYGRALQAPVLQAWQGKTENVAVAQAAFAKRAKLNGLAREGKYRPDME